MILKSNIQSKDSYKPKEIANMLGVTPKTVTNYMERGYLKYKTTGGRHRYVMADDLIEYLNTKGLLYDDLSDKINILYALNGVQADKLSRYSVDNNIKNNMIVLDSEENDGIMEILKLVLDNKVSTIYCITRIKLGLNKYLIEVFNKFNINIVDINL